MWTQVVQILSNIFTNYIEGHLVLIIMSALGLAGGWWAWVVKFGVDQAVKKIEPELKKEAAFQDEKSIEKKNLETYKDAVKKGDLNEISDSANKLLNG